MSGPDLVVPAKSALWSAIENGGLSLISFMCLILYSRMLPINEFGLFSVVLALIELLGILVTMTFHDALVQRERVTELHYDTAYTVSWIISLILAGCCLLAAPMAASWSGIAKGGLVFSWLTLCLPSSALTSTIVARRRRNFQFRLLALRSLAGRLSGAAAGIVLILLGGGIWALVAQQVLVVVVGSAVLWITADDRPRLRFRFKEFWELITFGFFSAGTLFIGFSVQRVFVLLAGAGLGTAGAGILNMSVRVVHVLWAIAATAVSQVALPLLSRARSDDMLARRVYRTGVSYSCTVLYLCFVLLALTAPELVDILFGSRWRPAEPYVVALSLLVILQAPKLLDYSMLTAVGKPRDAALSLAAELMVVLAAGLFLGIPSLPWAMVIWIARELFSTPILGWLLWRATRLNFADQFLGAAVPLVGACVMAACVLGLRSLIGSGMQPIWRLMLLIPTGTTAYVLTIVLLDRSLARSIFVFVGRAFGR